MATIKKLLDRDYVFRGVIYPQGIADVPEDFTPGVAIGEPASGAALGEEEAALLVALTDPAQLRAALKLKGITAPEGADRAAMLALVGLGVPPAGAGQTAGGPRDYAAMDKADLEAEAARRGLTVSGSGAHGNVLKADLVEALQASDAAGAGTPAP